MGSIIPRPTTSSSKLPEVLAARLVVLPRPPAAREPAPEPGMHPAVPQRDRPPPQVGGREPAAGRRRPHPTLQPGMPSADPDKELTHQNTPGSSSSAAATGLPVRAATRVRAFTAAGALGRNPGPEQPQEWNVNPASSTAANARQPATSPRRGTSRSRPASTIGPRQPGQRCSLPGSCLNERRHDVHTKCVR